MSLDASKWAWTQVADQGLGAAEALVLLRIADHASRQENGEFSCWPGVDQLAEATGRGEKTVRRALTSLEDAGLIGRERRVKGKGRGRSVDLILLPVEGWTNRSESPVSESDQAVTPTGKSEESTGQPDPTNRSSSPDQPVIVTGPTGHSDPPLYGEPEKEPEEEPTREPVRVGGREVAEEEHQLTFSLIRAFAVEAQQRFTPENWIEFVVPCLRAHPELTENDHLAIIRANFREPWWEGPPTPAVIYSRVSVFERALALWRGGGPQKRKRSAGMDQAHRFAEMAEQAEAEERAAV